jgi:hypothetical protein
MKKSQMVCSCCMGFDFSEQACHCNPELKVISRGATGTTPDTHWCMQGRWREWDEEYNDWNYFYWGDWEEDDMDPEHPIPLWKRKFEI